MNGAADSQACLACEGLRLLAAWRGDRWRITAQVRPVEEWVSLFDLWDPADGDCGPVFQQCYTRQQGDGFGELLLVGQTGKRHYSGVLSVVDDRLRIDIADRLPPSESEQSTGLALQLCNPVRADLSCSTSVPCCDLIQGFEGAEKGASTPRVCRATFCSDGEPAPGRLDYDPRSGLIRFHSILPAHDRPRTSRTVLDLAKLDLR